MTCKNCADWKYYAQNLELKIEKLEEEKNKYWNRADKAENTISRELTPRIEREKRGYDMSVGDPQSSMNWNPEICEQECDTVWELKEEIDILKEKLTK